MAYEISRRTGKKGESIRIGQDCGYESNGKKKIITRTVCIPHGTSKRSKEKLIREACDELERSIKGGANIQNGKIKFKEFVSGIYEKNHLCTLKEKTASEYRAIIKKRLCCFFGEMYLRDITALDVRRWLAGLEREKDSDKPLSENSKGVWFRTLSAIMGKAKEWELIESNPCENVKMPRKPQSDVKALEQADVQKIFNAFDNYDDIRIVTLVKLLLLTGMRNGECRGLQWSDINFDDCSIRINRECVDITGKGVIESTPKSMSSRRIIYIPESLCEDLERYKLFQMEQIWKRGDLWIGGRGENAKLFTQFDGKPVASKTITLWVKRFFKWCDVPYVTVHGLRHTFASLLISNGVDARTAAAQLGHSSTYLVYNTYANPQESAKRRAADLIGDIVSINKEVI